MANCDMYSQHRAVHQGICRREQGARFIMCKTPACFMNERQRPIFNSVIFPTSMGGQIHLNFVTVLLTL